MCRKNGLDENLTSWLSNNHVFPFVLLKTFLSQGGAIDSARNCHLSNDCAKAVSQISIHNNIICKPYTGISYPMCSLFWHYTVIHTLFKSEMHYYLEIRQYRKGNITLLLGIKTRCMLNKNNNNVVSIKRVQVETEYSMGSFQSVDFVYRNRFNSVWWWIDDTILVLFFNEFEIILQVSFDCWSRT